MSDEIKEMINEFASMKKKLSEEVRTKLHSAFAPVFQKYPEIQAFGALAFTPYFNDGDVCEYSVHGLEVYISPVIEDGEGNPLDFEDEEYEDEEENLIEPYEGQSLHHIDKKYKEDLKPLFDLFNAIPDEIMNAAFDEGFIKITREGIEVEEYDHD
jgi:hypothetical protein